MQDDRSAQDSATNDPMIAALLRERVGYEARGLADRVEAVNEQLRLRGFEVESQPRAAKPRQGRQQTRAANDSD